MELDKDIHGSFRRLSIYSEKRKGRKTPNAHSVLSFPRPVHVVYAPTHKRAFRPEKEANHARCLLCSPVPPERRRRRERIVLCQAAEVPLLLHERRVDGAGRDAVDADLAVAVLEGRGLAEADDAVLAGVVAAVAGESCGKVPCQFR